MWIFLSESFKPCQNAISVSISKLGLRWPKKQKTYCAVILMKRRLQVSQLTCNQVVPFVVHNM